MNLLENKAVFCLCYGLLYLGYLCASQSCLQDVCQKPQFCDTNHTLADATNCTKFHLCLYFEWIPMSCSPGTFYDTVDCTCTYPDDAQCYDVAECPTLGPDVTVQPDLCDGVPTPCQDGKKYADTSSCYHFFPCKDGLFGERERCQLGPSYGVCNISGYPCVFDIYGKQCIHPYGTFDCRYRCQTTIEPPVTSPLDAIMTTGVADEVTEEFTMVSEITEQMTQTATDTTAVYTSMTSQGNDVTVEVTTAESHTTESLDQTTTYLQSATTTSDSSSPLGAILGGVLAVCAVLVLVVTFLYFKYIRGKPDETNDDKNAVLESPEVGLEARTLKIETIAKFPGNKLLWRTDPVYLTERGLPDTTEVREHDMTSFTAPYVENPLYAHQESTDFFQSEI